VQYTKNRKGVTGKMKESLNTKAIERIATSLSAVDVDFDSERFVKLAQAGVDELALKERVDHIISALVQCLPSNFEDGARVLSKVKKVWVAGDEDDAYQSFAAWPVIDYIAVQGIDHPDLALELLKHLTSLFSAEFAIRAFIVRYPSLCQQYFVKWVHDSDEHVRRLVSEGTRPRLPWGKKLALYIEQPAINIEHLSVLKDDSSLYVRRSVANHLNDIAKDHPEFVVDVCEQWLDKGGEHVQWVVTHATRSLVKQGVKRVYPLLGYTAKPAIEKLGLNILSLQLCLGGCLEFGFTLQSCGKVAQKLVVDYAIGFVKANGERRNKVFKLKNITLKQGQVMELNKRHVIKAITTRRYYSGVQSLSILINGEPVIVREFELICD